MSDKGKWVDTELKGSIEIAELGKEKLDGASIRMVAIDNLGVRRGILMEWELPYNFVFKPKQTKLFSSIQLLKGNHIGFLFETEKFRESFDEACHDLEKQLKKTDG